MTEDQIAQQLTEILRSFLARVRGRLPHAPFARCEYDGVDIHGVRSPYVEFELGDAAEHLYLMFFVTKTEPCVEITADFGFSTTKLSSLPALRLSAAADRNEVAAVLDKAREFAFAQVNRAVEEIGRSDVN